MPTEVQNSQKSENNRVIVGIKEKAIYRRRMYSSTIKLKNIHRFPAPPPFLFFNCKKPSTRKGEGFLLYSGKRNGALTRLRPSQSCLLFRKRKWWCPLSQHRQTNFITRMGGGFLFVWRKKWCPVEAPPETVPCSI